ncbi:MAG: S-layer homology domain-containing protein [Syntrophomonadaceae bacterium]
MKKRIWALVTLFLLATLLSTGGAWAKSNNGQDKGKGKKAESSQSSSVDSENSQNGHGHSNNGNGHKKFSDTEAHWAAGSIGRMTEKGLFSGYPDGTFKPDQPMTQVEAVILVMNLAGEDTSTGTDTSVDEEDEDLNKVPSWAQDAASRAAHKGVIKLNRFHSQMQCTRAQTAVMLAIALGLEPEKTDDIPFKDGILLSSEDVGYIMALYREGIIVGSNGNFNPNSAVTRAQMACMLEQALKELEQNKEVESVTLPATAQVEAGKSVALTAMVKYADATTDDKVVWASSDTTLATVANGVVTAVPGKTGTVTITAAAAADNTKSASCVVTVMASTTKEVTSVTLPATAQVEAGKSVTLTAVVKYADATTDDNVVWTSSDTTLATVANGVVTAVAGKTGTITITAAAAADNTKSASCVVTVVASTTKEVTSVTLPATAQVEAGKTVALAAVVSYSDSSTDNNVTWTSGDTTLATVDNGVVTAVAGKTGTVAITATAASDATKAAACVVTVIAATP